MSITITGSIRCFPYKPIILGSFFYCSQPLQVSINQTAKVVNVAIIGSPNSGKSTLINSIVGRRVCAASNKVHTTTKMVRAMCFENDTQIIFLDTPGVVTEKEQKRYKLPETMIHACQKSLRCADVVGVVHDVSNKWTRDAINKDVKAMLHLVEDIPSFLILNKVEKLKSKKQLLTVIRNLTNGFIAGNPIPGKKGQDNISKQETQNGYSKFSDVFLVSALNGDGVSDVKQYLMSNAKPANLQYSSEEWTDAKPETLIVETVRAKFLDFLHQEIPYNLKTSLEFYEDKGDKIICYVTVECASERLLILIGGAGGGRLQQIKSSVRNDLIDLFKKMVSIDIQLRVDPRLKS